MNQALRHSAGACTGPKRLTEDPFLRSTIRHQIQNPNLRRLGFFLGGWCGLGHFAEVRGRVA